jgi:hypothetical protein
MAIKFSEAVRNARLDAIETIAGTDCILKLRTGAAPANCAAANSGTIVATIVLPTDWMNAAASGSKTKAGVWEDVAADAGGTVLHFRIYDSTDTTCHMQGTVTITGGGGDLELNNNVVVAGQTITITAFSLTDGNA